MVSHSHVNVYQRVDGENPIDGKNSLATHQLLKIQLYRFPEDELIGEAVKGLKPSPTVLPDMIRSMVCTCKSKASKPRTSQRAGAVASLLKDVFPKNRKDAERCPNLPKSYSRNNCDTVLGIYELSENPLQYSEIARFLSVSRLPSNRQGHRETKLKQGCHTTQGCPWRMRGWASV